MLIWFEEMFDLDTNNIGQGQSPSKRTMQRYGHNLYCRRCRNKIHIQKNKFSTTVRSSPVVPYVIPQVFLSLKKVKISKVKISLIYNLMNSQGK